MYGVKFLNIQDEQIVFPISKHPWHNRTVKLRTKPRYDNNAGIRIYTSLVDAARSGQHPFLVRAGGRTVEEDNVIRTQTATIDAYIYMGQPVPTCVTMNGIRVVNYTELTNYDIDVTEDERGILRTEDTQIITYRYPHRRIYVMTKRKTHIFKPNTEFIGAIGQTDITIHAPCDKIEAAHLSNTTITIHAPVNTTHITRRSIAQISTTEEGSIQNLHVSNLSICTIHETHGPIHNAHAENSILDIRSDNIHNITTDNSIVRQHGQQEHPNNEEAASESK